jgi:hypothetical protein
MSSEVGPDSDPEECRKDTGHGACLYVRMIT